MSTTLTEVPLSENTHTKNRIIAPILLGLSLMIAILVVKPLYTSMVEKEANISRQESEISKLSKEHEELLAIKARITTSSGTSLDAQVKKIAEKYDRANIMSAVLFSSYTKGVNTAAPSINIGTITVSEKTKLPNGLSLSRVNIGLTGRTIDEIVAYLTYLTTETAYAFTLEDISLPIDTAPEGDLPNGYSLALSLGVYTHE